MVNSNEATSNIQGNALRFYFTLIARKIVLKLKNQIFSHPLAITLTSNRAKEEVNWTQKKKRTFFPLLSQNFFHPHSPLEFLHKVRIIMKGDIMIDLKFFFSHPPPLACKLIEIFLFLYPLLFSLFAFHASPIFTMLSVDKVL